jgi:hypothetical protein
MSRYRVYWLIQAEEDLAELWSRSRLRGLLTAAIYQLENDLIDRAHEVGRPFPLSQLDDAATNLMPSGCTRFLKGYGSLKLRALRSSSSFRRR